MTGNNETKPRKGRRKPGDQMVSQNGYSYTYIEGPDGVTVRMLTHHLIGREKYGRPPRDDERVVFDDGDRSNLDPENISYVKKSNPLASLKRRRVNLADRIRELQAQLDEVDRELEEYETKKKATR